MQTGTGLAKMPRIILSGFADEAVRDRDFKDITEQLGTFSGLGFEYYTPRFVNFGAAGEQNRNVVTINDPEVSVLQDLQGRYGMTPSSIGSPFGKVKLVNQPDDSTNVFVEPAEYLDRVARGIHVAKRLGTNLIRGFPGYPPLDKTQSPQERRKVLDDYRGASVGFLGPILGLCEKEGVFFGLEVEANLTGYDGVSTADIKRQVNSPNLLLVYDGANVLVQGLLPFSCYYAMKDGIGWFHIKDYKSDGSIEWKGHVDEEMLRHFVPADEGQVGHEMIFREFRDRIPVLEEKLAANGIPGVFMELEPHVKGGGQFGGYSGPDGMERALRGLTSVLDRAGIGYSLNPRQVY